MIAPPGREPSMGLLRQFGRDCRDFLRDIGRDFRAMGEELKRPETWVMLGMMALFALVIFVAFYFALRFDSTRRLWNLSSTFCQDLGNSQTAALFFAVAAFGLAMVTALGEFTRYMDNKRQGLRHQGKTARTALLLAAVTLIIGAGVSLFLERMCQ